MERSVSPNGGAGHGGALHQPAVPPPDRAELASFLEHLDRLARRDGKILSGHLHLLGLERIRDQLGGEWARHAATAQTAAAAIIVRHLEPDDFHVRYDELSFLIVFARRDPAAARDVCQRMATEIGRFLMGEAFDESRGLVNASVHVDDGALVRRVVAGEVAATPSPRHDGLPANDLPQVDGRAMVRALRVRYAPVWEASRGIVTTYYAVPVADGFFDRAVRDHDARLQLHAFMPDHAFDLEVARLGIADLVRSLLRGQQTLVCWQVDLQTLTSRQGREAYLQLLHQLPEPARRSLVLEMAGFTAAVPAASLVEASALLRPHCRFQIARVAPDFSRMDLLSECQFRIVGTGLHGGAMRERLQRAFAAQAKRVHLRPYAAGLHGGAEIGAALDAGFELLTSFDDAVMVNQPGPPHRIDPAALRSAP